MANGDIVLSVVPTYLWPPAKDRSHDRDRFATLADLVGDRLA
jgi:hypothetical protein